MTDMTIDDLVEVPDELAALKARADLMGVPYHPSIGLEKLREKINASIFSAPEAVVAVVAEDPQAESEGQFRARLRREANELLRVRLSCMNPAKKEWDGEVFTAGNSLVGSFTKYVPFNNEEGWHIPRIIYNQITQRQCQVFTSSRDERGNDTRKGKLIREFAVEVLPELTSEELAELARRQAMSKSID